MSPLTRANNILSEYARFFTKINQKKQHGNPIFIAGMQRSGTTWVANMLNVPGLRVYNEPLGRYSSVLFNHGDIPFEIAKSRIDYGLDKIMRGKDYRHFVWNHPEHFKRQTNGRLSPIALFGLSKGRVVIKDPLAIENLSYISAGRQMDFLVLIRSSYGYVSSLKKLDWLPTDRIIKLLNHSKFERFNFSENDYLKGKSIRDLNKIELFALQYFMLKSLLDDFVENTNNFVKVYVYEDLCKDSGYKFKSLFEDFGLNYDEQVKIQHEYLTQSNSQKIDFAYSNQDQGMIHHYTKRNSELYSEIYKSRLSGYEMDIIDNIAESFN